MKNATLIVDGIHCKSCEMLIEGSLKDVGVEKVFFGKNNMVKVFFEENKVKLNKIKEAIRNEGYKVN